ncbi:MAG: hypothetical protein JWQ28_976, partial [Pedobacter sp.]|nr:hypothetical protein [Pedobacter sp.]
MRKKVLIIAFAFSCLFSKMTKAQSVSNEPAAKLNHIAMYVSDLDRSANF